MSLSEALLLDPYPFEVWIANRGADGPRGSGTQADPWNAATIPSSVYPALNISSLTSSGSLATATTTDPHGFQTGDWITISGVDLPIDPYASNFLSLVGNAYY